MIEANTSYKQNGVPVSIPSGSYGIAPLTVHQYEYPKGHPCHNCPYTGGPYLLAALLTHGKTLAIGGGDIKLMGACGFVLGVWPGLLHSILSLILAVLTGVMLFGVRRQDFSSIRLPLAPFFCIGGVTAYWLAAAAAVI